MSALRGIFFCDVDGTILPHGQKDVDQPFFDLVHQGHESGWLFCISSGRVANSLLPLFTPIDEVAIFSACNGCSILHRGTPLIPDHTIESERAREMITSLLEWGAIPMVATTGGLSLPKVLPWEHHRTAYYKSRPFVTHFARFEHIANPILQITALCKENLDEVLQKSRDAWAHSLMVTLTGEAMFDIAPTDKGRSLLEVVQHFNLDRDRTWAFGDNENDIQMLRSAGSGYLMSGAHPALHTGEFGVCHDVVTTIQSIMDES